jgi:hypothetical protein
MKRYIKLFCFLLLGSALVAGLAGCKKFLDRKPLGVAIEDDIEQGGVEGAVFGIYGSLRLGGMSGWNSIWFQSIRSDDAKKGSTPDDAKNEGTRFDDFQYDKAPGVAEGYWNDHYTFILQCNNVLHDIDSLGLTDEASMVNKAEASFLRAYAYFDLVRDFGEVPKIDFKVYQTSEANIPKSPVNEIYALIDQDLAFAEQVLPPTWDAKYIGRATQGAANALHAKTLLYRKDWGQALAKAEAVINSHLYSLYSPSSGYSYEEFFKESGENSSESIFEIQMYENANGSVVFGNERNQVQGVRGDGDWDLGWGFNVPTQDLYDSYEAGDPRREATILESGKPDGVYGQTVPSYLGAIQPYWNKKVYTDPLRRQQTGDRFAMWLNIRVLRYADVLLMAAEASTEIGGADNLTRAKGYLEQIRQRARGGDNSILPPVVTNDQGELRNAVRRERRAEMAMESERFYDLVRWGLADSVLAPLGYQPRNKYYPIPQSVIDKSSGELKQNPDWD